MLIAETRKCIFEIKRAQAPIGTRDGQPDLVFSIEINGKKASALISLDDGLLAINYLMNNKNCEIVNAIIAVEDVDQLVVKGDDLTLKIGYSGGSIWFVVRRNDKLIRQSVCTIRDQDIWRNLLEAKREFGA